LQLACEAERLFTGTLIDLGVTVDYVRDGEVPLPSITDYVEKMRILLWDTAFFREFKVEKGVHKNNPCEKQLGFKQAMQRTLYRYFKYVLFPAKAISKSPPFFDAYLDTGSEECMFTDGILRDWSAAHLEKCGWYLDTPLKRPPTFDVAFRNSVQPDLLGVEVVSSKSLEKVEGKKVKKTRGNKAAPTMAVEVPVADPIMSIVVDLPSSSNVVGPSHASRTITVAHSQPSSFVLASQQLLKRKSTLAAAASGSTSAIQSSMCLMENTSISTIMEVGVSHPFLLDSHLFVKKVSYSYSYSKYLLHISIVIVEVLIQRI
jgi:hypothetical protein